MVCRITTVTGWTTFDKAVACAAIHRAMCMKACGIRTDVMVSAQCTGLIAVSLTLAAGKTVYRSTLNILNLSFQFDAFAM